MAEKEFARGFYWNEPSQNAPTWVIGSVSINKEQFLGWLEKQTPNEKGYVRLNVKEGKEGKTYVELDTWRPRETPVADRREADRYQNAKDGIPYDDPLPF